MSVFLFVLLSLVAGALADCKPNTTDFAWKQCMDSPIVSFSKGSLKPYPLNPNTPPNVLSLTYTITNGMTYDNFNIDIDIQWFGEAFGQCKFQDLNVPLRGLPGCGVIADCPLVGDGMAHDASTYDLAGYVSILEAFHSNTYYSVHIVLRDTSEQSKQIGCVDAQFLII
jgi:hypothetical protein